MTIRVQSISFTNSTSKVNSTKNNQTNNIKISSKADSVSFGALSLNTIEPSTKSMMREIHDFYKNAKYIFQQKHQDLINEFGGNGVTVRFKGPYSSPKFEFDAKTSSDINIRLEELGETGAKTDFALRIGEYSGKNTNERRSIIFSGDSWTVQVIDEKLSRGIFEKTSTWKPFKERIETTEPGIRALNKEIQGYLEPLVEKYSKFADLTFLRKSSEKN